MPRSHNGYINDGPKAIDVKDETHTLIEETDNIIDEKNIIVRGQTLFYTQSRFCYRYSVFGSQSYREEGKEVLWDLGLGKYCILCL